VRIASDGRDWDENGYFCGYECKVCLGKGIVNLTQKDDENSLWCLLHPKIVEISKSRFDTGHFADSVEAAMKEVNNKIKMIVKDKIGREYDGANLMTTALSVQNPVIRLADLSTESGRNIQLGYMHIFSGSMTGIRNPKAHGNLVLDIKRATHLLVLASLLMYKVDEDMNL